MPEIDSAEPLGACLWPPPAGPGEEACLLDGQLAVVGVDAGDNEGNVRKPIAGCAAGRRELVQPGVVEVTGAKLLAVEQVEQEASIGGAAFDDHGGLGQGPPQPDERLAAVTTPAGQLGDHGVEFGRDVVPLDHARVDSDAWPGGQAKQGDGTGRRREVVLGVLGVDPHFDGMAHAGRGMAFEPPALGDVELRLDQIEPGCGLGDGVLDLQPGVDLQEPQDAVRRAVQELHRPRPAVSGLLRPRVGRRRALQPPVRA